MQTFAYMAMAIALGAIVAIYMPMNGQISKHLDSAIAANIVFYMIGLLTTVLLLAIFVPFDTMKKVSTIPPYLFLSGIMSALMIFGMTYLMPILGARQLFILIIAGQIIMAMLVSHFQLFKVPSDPLNTRKLLGAALVMAGVLVSVTH